MLVVVVVGFRSVRSVSAGWAMPTPRAKRSCTTLILRGRTKASCRRSRTIRCVVRLCVFKSALGSIRSSWNAQKRGRFGLALHFVFVRRACLGKLSFSNDDSNHQQYLNRNAPWFRLISEIGPSAAAERLPFPRLCAGLRALLRRALPPAVLAGVGQRLSYAGLVGV